jgi:uncharacterized protein (DUF2461 family)
MQNSANMFILGENMKEKMNPFEISPLSEDEFNAVKDWFSENKDSFSGNFKQGLRKMLDNETKRGFLNNIEMKK